jgi:hypothetical protein
LYFTCFLTATIENFQEFWTEIAKNRLEQSLDALFWTVVNRPEKWVGNSDSGWFGQNRPEFVIFF